MSRNNKYDNSRYCKFDAVVEKVTIDGDDYIEGVSKGSPFWEIYFPQLQGCFSYGDDREEVMVNGIESLKNHIYNMIEDGEEIPDYISASGDGDSIVTILVDVDKLREIGA